MPCRVCCAALSIGGTGTANALVVDWVDGTSFWDIVTNWRGGFLPSATDDVLINVGGVPTTTHRIGNATIRTLGISQPATVAISNASSLTVTNGGANTGTFRADGGTFNLFGSVVTNSGGTLNTATGGVIRVVGSAGLSGQTSWAGAMAINGLVEVGNGGVLGTAGTFNNNGTILLNSSSSGNNVVFNVAGATTLQGFGKLTMSDSGSNFVYGVAATDRLTNAASHTIQGSGNIGNNFMTMSNHGLVQANQTAALVIDPSNCLGCGLTNSGTLRAGAGSTLTVIDGLTNFSGSTLSGGAYEVYGTASQAGTMRLTNANVVTNAATILLDGPNSNLLRHDTATNALANFATSAAAGSFTIQNGRNFVSAGLLINAGNVTVGPASTLTVGGGANFVQTAGTTTVNGTLTAALADIQGGILKGNGTVSGNAINQAGTVAPGNNAPETLTVEGSFSQLAGGALNIEIDGLSSFDLLAVSGNAALGGTLNVIKLANYNPHVGDSFRVMTFADHGATTFYNVNYSGFGAGVLFGVVYNPTNVTLQVAAVPEAETWAMLLVGIGLIGFRLRGGRLAKEGTFVRWQPAHEGLEQLRSHAINPRKETA